MQEKLEDIDDDEEVAPNEQSSSGSWVNVYQCSQAMPKTNTEKQLQKKNDRYNIRSKGASMTLREAQEKMRLVMTKDDPSAAHK